jgi:hypothetical protein
MNASDGLIADIMITNGIIWGDGAIIIKKFLVKPEIYEANIAK